MNYKNRFFKIDALKGTGNVLNFSADEVDRKLRNMNYQSSAIDAFTKEGRNLERRTNSTPDSLAIP
jgi:hypothetical protein